MPNAHQASSELSSFLIAVPLAVFVLCYVRGWRRIPGANAIPVWRLVSFVFGMVLIWVALGSPLSARDHDLLTVHMILHLLLMTFAPALILLSEPFLALWDGLPIVAKTVLTPQLQRPFLRRIGWKLSRPVLCWAVSALTLMGWHVPALFTLAMHSELLHGIEQVSFLIAGLLFWWPVLRPWPSAHRRPQWSTLLYLFFATIPCDILSGFLVFSDRVAYPVYFSMPRHFSFSVLEDQQCAAALMWTCVTLVYLVPAAILSNQLLSPQSSYAGELVQPELRGRTAEDRNPQSWEAA